MPLKCCNLRIREVIKTVDYSKTTMEGFSVDEWWGMKTRLVVSQ